MTHALLGTWGRPPDALSKLALGTAIALVLLVVSGRGRTLLHGDDIPRRHFLAVAAFVASLFSLFWIATYLRGGPRIIDATTYFLQGRALSQGDLAWSLPSDLPSASFRGRFLLFRDGELGGIFPPGFPLLLAAGFTVGAPMIIGPILAGALVFATYFLARAIAEEVVDASLVEPVARGAALLSITSAALRYHTADTMSHGATALGIAIALTCALRGRAGLAGLALGGIVATRPVSALPIGLVVLLLLGRRRVLRVALGALPGVLLLLLSQKAVTGSWLSSTQRAYYAASDGPPGCFRYGFGEGIGCLGEHGEFVQKRLANGYGVIAAIGTTLRRLRMHLGDVANLEPLALLVLGPLASSRVRRARSVVAASSLVFLHVLAYAPFYFDGNYPGGGARFFADVLPVEHALVVVGLGVFAGRSAASPDRRLRRVLFGFLAVALAGFAVHAAYDHIQLAERDGGRPMYEPDLLLRQNVREGLVYVDSDHGFALGHHPGMSPKDGVLVVRLRGDDRDRILFDRLDRPPTWLYRRDDTGPVLQPWAPPDTSRPFRFEAEAEWPALHQEGGLVVPVQVDACASNSRALAVAPIPKDGAARARIAVPVPETGRYRVVVRVVRGAVVPHTEGVIDPKMRGVGVAKMGDLRWEWADEASGCTDLADKETHLTAPAATLEIEAIGGLVAVDRVTLMPRNR